MTREASGAQFEIKVDGIVRTHCDFRETAIEVARFLQQRNAELSPGSPPAGP